MHPASVRGVRGVRDGRGMGVISASVWIALISSHCCDEPHMKVFSLLFTRYFKYADVQYYTLWAVREICLERSQAATSGSGSVRPSVASAVGKKKTKKGR